MTAARSLGAPPGPGGTSPAPAPSPGTHGAPASVEDVTRLLQAGGRVQLIEGRLFFDSAETAPRPAHAGVGDVVRAEPFEAIDLPVGELFGRETSD